MWKKIEKKHFLKWNSFLIFQVEEAKRKSREETAYNKNAKLIIQSQDDSVAWNFYWKFYFKLSIETYKYAKLNIQWGLCLMKAILQFYSFCCRKPTSRQFSWMKAFLPKSCPSSVCSQGPISILQSEGHTCCRPSVCANVPCQTLPNCQSNKFRGWRILSQDHVFCERMSITWRSFPNLQFIVAQFMANEVTSRGAEGSQKEERWPKKKCD